jgi:predicted small lipoprotein YifL
MRLFLTMLLSICLLGACGLKGPLYLPKVDEASASSSEAQKK